jgi:hypothetical protein
LGAPAAFGEAAATSNRQTSETLRAASRGGHDADSALNSVGLRVARAADDGESQPGERLRQRPHQQQRRQKDCPRQPGTRGHVVCWTVHKKLGPRRGQDGGAP